jgi:hypothetical protein
MQPERLINDNINCCERLLRKDLQHDDIERIMNFSDGRTRLVDRYTTGFLLEYFDRSKLECLEEVFKDPSTKMDVVQFVRFFLNAIDHNESDTLFLTMALIDTFK